MPRWREKWARDNPGYFPLERRLTEKARAVGYLEKADLVEIAGVLGSRFRIGALLRKYNSDTEVRDKTREAIGLLGDPEAAYRALTSLKRWGMTYGSKTLRCVCPRDYGALDSRLHEGIDRNKYFPARDEAQKYCQFLDLLRVIRGMVVAAGPRDGEWFLADVEFALFQFVLEGGRIV